MWLILYKFILGWLLPPGIFVLSFIYIAWMTRKKTNDKHTLVFYIAFTSAIALFLFSNSIFTNLLSRGLERHLPVTNTHFSPSNIIIVLSGGIHENTPVSFSSLRATPTQFALVRLTEAVRIYREITEKGYSCTIVLTGGIFPGTTLAESDVYKEWLLSIGIPENAIVAERSSRTTFENARYVNNVVQQTNAESVFLVTSAWHMPRSLQTFTAYGMNVIPAPCDFTQPIRFSLLSMVPRSEHLQKTGLFAWEYLGSIYYSLKIHTMKTTKRTKHE